jgi:outer membrane protein TolC
LRLTQENLQAGTGLTVDVLQAEDAADRARYRYAMAIVRYNQSEVNLLAALGLIDQNSLLTSAPTSPPAPESSRPPGRERQR